MRRRRRLVARASPVRDFLARRPPYSARSSRVSSPSCARRPSATGAIGLRADVADPRSPRNVSGLSLLFRAALSLILQRTHARSAQAPRLELACELRDHSPFPSGRRSLQGDRERVLDAQRAPCRLNFAWPNVDQLSRTCVNSRGVLLTRVDWNRREFNGFRGFKSRRRTRTAPGCTRRPFPSRFRRPCTRTPCPSRTSLRGRGRRRFSRCSRTTSRSRSTPARRWRGRP